MNSTATLSGATVTRTRPELGKTSPAAIGVLVVEGVIRIGGLGQGLVDDPIELLPGEDVVVALKEDGHAALRHQRMDGQFPAGTFLSKLPVAPFVLAAPLKQAGVLDAASASAEHVVREDEFVPGLALLERPLEPGVLGVAERDFPQVAVRGLLAAAERIIDGRRRVPVGVDHGEQRIAPRPCVVIPEQADELYGLRVAGVERVGRRLREEPVARGLRPDCDVVRRAVQIARGRLLVVAIDQKDGGRAGHQPQERALEMCTVGPPCRH